MSNLSNYTALKPFTPSGVNALHTFRDLIDDTLHFAVSVGDLNAPGSVPVRVQPMNTLRDFLGTRLDDNSVPGWSYRAAMEHISAEQRGVVVLLGGTETPHTILEDLDHLLHANG